MFKKGFLFILIFLLLPFCSEAAGNYYYDNIKVNIQINRDSTFDVSENQTYFLNGSFGYFYRDIDLKGLDDISDVKVLDSDGNAVPNPEIFYKNNKLHIQWNFPRKDFNNELKSWTVEYKVHGGLGFYKDHDEIYWNAIFSDRTVNIKKAAVSVLLPTKPNIEKMFIGPNGSEKESYDYEIKENEVIFLGYNIAPQEFLTVVAGWPKGFIKKPFLYQNQIIVLTAIAISTLIPLFAFIYCFIIWRRKGRDAKINKTIIAQYEPFQNLPPAVAGVLVYQNINSKFILATIIDLAVRGYLKITEKEKGFSIFKYREYIFEKRLDGDNLKNFEKKILDSVFESADIVSSGDLRNKFYKKIPGIKKDIYGFAAETQFFNGNIQKIRQKYGFIWGIIIFLSILTAIVLMIQNLSPIIISSAIIFLSSLAISSVIGLIFSYFMPALTSNGAEAKWHMLGFKNYLNIAERFRIGAETIETFSKFLPYAIVFGVEKQWAERFAYFNYQPQNWYAPAAIYSGNSGMPASFGELSSSFNSFFQTAKSAFSPPSGGGGGGGSAGGGGGGGGGGAG